MDTQKLIEEFKTSPLTGTERIGALNLSFLPEMEARYRRHSSTANALFTQCGMGLGLILVIVLVVADAIGLDRSLTPQARSIFLWVIFPEMFISSLLSLIPRMRPYLALICSINIFILTTGFIVVCFLMQSASPDTSAPYIYETLILTILFAFLFSGLGYAYASFIGLGGTAAFLVTQWFAGIDTYSLYYTALFLLAANCLGLFNLYVMEYSQRRPWDLAARYGGDEFVVFLYDISEEDMQKVTQRLLEQVRSIG